MSDVQNNIATGYLASFEIPIGVSVMSKLTNWQYLQQLGFAGSLSKMSATFHGLGDFSFQMDKYSSTNAILRAAWKLIQPIVPFNAKVQALMYTDPVLGHVGQDFASLSNFGQVFAVSPDELQDPDSVQIKVSSLS